MDHFTSFIGQYWTLWVLFIVLLVAWLVIETKVQSGMRDLSPKDAVGLMNQKHSQIIDIRPEELFNQGHIVNAKRIDITELADKVKPIKNDYDAPMIVNCQKGITAKTAVNVLKKAGFKNVHGLQGGFLNWRKEGLPVTKPKTKTAAISKSKKKGK